MASDIPLYLKPYGGEFEIKEGGAPFGAGPSGLGSKCLLKPGSVPIMVADFAFGTEQTLNIGSQSAGAGAGKVMFNSLRIRRSPDAFSRTLFLKQCQGTSFMYAAIVLRKSAGGTDAQGWYLIYYFSLVAIRSISTTMAEGDVRPTEIVEFDYGGLQVVHRHQNPDGSFESPLMHGWNRVKNVLMDDFMDPL